MGLTKESVIVITGAAGFIGSIMTGFLNDHGYENLILVDEFGSPEKELNLKGKAFLFKIDREIFFEWVIKNKPDVKVVIHFGARTDTTEFDYSIHQHLNVEYSQKMWKYCTENNIPLIYASSAATYGSGELGYKDDHELPFKLEPLNPYGISKNEFDKWALKEETKPPFWAGLKFFNVYGPNEYHKGRMASVIFHAVNQIQTVGYVKLFKSHRPEFRDGEQLRDFIYVKDVIKIAYWLITCCFLEGGPTVESGLYNVGTGKARSFHDLVTATFHALNLTPSIIFIDMPEDIRDKYQYFTQSDNDKILLAGYLEEYYSLEEGVTEFVANYLEGKKYF
ncbi:MAG: ADP-glyceromanno-heptose 6-epimerase [Ginsengibacter sp.]